MGIRGFFLFNFHSPNRDYEVILTLKLPDFDLHIAKDQTLNVLAFLLFVYLFLVLGQLRLFIVRS